MPIVPTPTRNARVRPAGQSSPRTRSRRVANGSECQRRRNEGVSGTPGQAVRVKTAGCPKSQRIARSRTGLAERCVGRLVVRRRVMVLRVIAAGVDVHSGVVEAGNVMEQLVPGVFGYAVRVDETELLGDGDVDFGDVNRTQPEPNDARTEHD